MTAAQRRQYSAAYGRLAVALATLQACCAAYPVPEAAGEPGLFLEVDDLAAGIEALADSEAAEQPVVLRDYLDEATAVTAEWCSREGLEESHARNIEALATMATLHGVLGDGPTFASLRNRVATYLLAAFQMGRAGAYGDNRRSR